MGAVAVPLAVGWKDTRTTGGLPLLQLLLPCCCSSESARFQGRGRVAKCRARGRGRSARMGARGMQTTAPCCIWWWVVFV